MRSVAEHKIAYAWVVNWADVGYEIKEPRVTVDYFFSSREKFEEVVGKTVASHETLVPIRVPLDFDDWDYCSDNY